GLFFHLPANHDRDQVPLLRRILKPDRATCRRPHTMVDDLDTRRLLIEEHPVILTAEHQNIHSRLFEIPRIIDNERARVGVLCNSAGAACERYQDGDGCYWYLHIDLLFDACFWSNLPVCF